MSERTDFVILGRKVADAAAVTGVYLDTYGVLSLTSELLARGVVPMVPVTTVTENILVSVARNDAEIIEAMRHDKRIHAIKTLRVRTLVGLKEAKDAIDAAYPRS